jgi:hypothetical protein
MDNGIFGDFRPDIDGIEGDHSGFKTNSDVEAVYFTNLPQMQFFPANIQTQFPNLKAIYIGSTGLKELTQADLKPFSKLEDFHAQWSQLTKIEKNLFEFNPQLKIIWLNDNQITHIEPLTFSNLSKLETLWISGNKCKMNFEKVVNSVSDVKSLVRKVDTGGCDPTVIEILKPLFDMEGSGNYDNEYYDDNEDDDDDDEDDDDDDEFYQVPEYKPTTRTTTTDDSEIYEYETTSKNEEPSDSSWNFTFMIICFVLGACALFLACVACFYLF